MNDKDQVALMGKKRVAIQTEYQNDNDVLTEQAKHFVEAVYPYLSVLDADRHLDSESAKILEGIKFFKLSSCTTENVEDMAAFLQEKMTKLFTAIHSIGSLAAYGIVSEAGQSNLVIGLTGGDGQAITKTILEGLLTGIETTSIKLDFSSTSASNFTGGVISSVPVYKTEEQQRFDISTLMRSLNGQNYYVLFLAKPYSLSEITSKYAQVLEVRDNCFAVSKRNISRQVSDSKTVTTTQGASHTRKGLLQEAFTQIREGQFSLKSIIDSVVDGGSKSSNDSYGQSDSFSVTDSIAHEVQNGFALEMMEYCDKAIERLRQGQNVGMWACTIVYSAETTLAARILKSCLYGELAKPSTDTLPLSSWEYALNKTERLRIPGNILKESVTNPLCVPVTSAELGMLCTPPFDSVPDFEIKKGKMYPMVGTSEDCVKIGSVSDGYRPLKNKFFALSEEDLKKHTFVCGITGSGKTTTVKGILQECTKPFMVIESAKKEYRNLKLPAERKTVTVYTLGKPEIKCLQFNPFYIQYGINLQTHIDFLKDLFNASFSFYGPMPYILEKCLNNIYRMKGWNLILGYHPHLINMADPMNCFDASYMKAQYKLNAHRYLFPTMQDLKDEVKRYIEMEMQYDGEVGGNIKTAILARLESLCVGAKGFMFNTNEPIDMGTLMNDNVVFELEGLADDSDKAFCVGLLVAFINEYRQVFKEEHPREKLDLQHVLVIEEAHRLLKNVETERTSEQMGNPKGKAVEHFTNMIAEMRSYGQGVIIAEQIPSKLAPDVIKNSSNKIIQRIVSADDQALIANTIGMKIEDSVFLGSLKTGYALCHKEGMSLPVYVAVNNVDDQYISDADMFIQEKDAAFEKINSNLIKAAMGGHLSTLGLKLLNTLLAEEPQKVILAIKECKNQIETQLSIDGTFLLGYSDTNRVFGRVLSAAVLGLLTYGVYGTNRIIPDNLIENFDRLFILALPELVAPVKDALSKEYSEQSRSRCILIISELIKSEYNNQVNIRESILQYFFPFVDEALVNAIERKVKEGLRCYR